MHIKVLINKQKICTIALDIITYDLLGGRNSNVVGTWTVLLINSVANTGLEAGTVGGITITLFLSLHVDFHPVKGFSEEWPGYQYNFI